MRAYGLDLEILKACFKQTLTVLLQNTLLHCCGIKVERHLSAFKKGVCVDCVYFGGLGKTPGSAVAGKNEHKGEKKGCCVVHLPRPTSPLRSFSAMDFAEASIRD